MTRASPIITVLPCTLTGTSWPRSVFDRTHLHDIFRRVPSGCDMVFQHICQLIAVSHQFIDRPRGQCTECGIIRCTDGERALTLNTSARPAACTALTSVLNEPASCAVSTIFFMIVPPARSRPRIHPCRYYKSIFIHDGGIGDVHANRCLSGGGTDA
jgi:hypothetical protein